MHSISSSLQAAAARDDPLLCMLIGLASHTTPPTRIHRDQPQPQQQPQQPKRQQAAATPLPTTHTPTPSEEAKRAVKSMAGAVGGGPKNVLQLVAVVGLYTLGSIAAGSLVLV
jgi:hypothetical protein